MRVPAFLLLIALLALIGGPAAASAACVAEFERGGSGCAICDGDVCTSCFDGYALAEDGTCVKCADPVRGGALEDQDIEAYCTCTADDPDTCLSCEALGGGRIRPGLFLNDAGVCDLCNLKADGTYDEEGRCYECAPGNGTCTICLPGHGLVPLGNGEVACEACQDESCTVCDGDPTFCTNCHSKSHSFADPETGTCVPCIENCCMCDNGDTCQLEDISDGCCFGYKLVGNKCVEDPDSY